MSAIKPDNTNYQIIEINGKTYNLESINVPKDIKAEDYKKLALDILKMGEDSTSMPKNAATDRAKEIKIDSKSKGFETLIKTIHMKVDEAKNTVFKLNPTYKKPLPPPPNSLKTTNTGTAPTHVKSSSAPLPQKIPPPPLPKGPRPDFTKSKEI
jgi:hypothetical protein